MGQAFEETGYKGARTDLLALKQAVTAEVICLVCVVCVWGGWGGLVCGWMGVCWGGGF